MKYTIIVVNYNKEKQIEICLNSIINQTYKNFELIIVDDGSTDNSKKIINKYKKYNNVKIFYKKNTGVSDTRNFAIEKVKTKYFLFVDSDDFIDEKLLEECEKYKDYDILSFDSNIIKNGKTTPQKSKGRFEKKDGKEVLYEYMKENPVFLVPWGYVYNIDLFRTNSLKYPKGYVHEDVYLTPIAILNAKKVKGIDFYGYNYVQTNESIIRSKDYEKQKTKSDSMIHVYKELIKYIDKNIDDEIIKKKSFHFFTNAILYEGITLNGKIKKEYIKKIGDMKVYNNINTSTTLGKLKKQIVKKNIGLYYFLFPFVPIIYKIFTFPRKVKEKVIKNEKE